MTSSCTKSAVAGIVNAFNPGVFRRAKSRNRAVLRCEFALSEAIVPSHGERGSPRQIRDTSCFCDRLTSQSLHSTAFCTAVVKRESPSCCKVLIFLSARKCGSSPSPPISCRANPRGQQKAKTKLETAGRQTREIGSVSPTTQTLSRLHYPSSPLLALLSSSSSLFSASFLHSTVGALIHFDRPLPAFRMYRSSTKGRTYLLIP